MKRSIPARAIGALGVTAVLLLLGACSGDSDADKDKDKKDESAEETTTTAAASTMSDEDFSAGLAEFSAAMEAASGDICKMSEAQALVPESSPANEKQMEQTMAVYTDMLRSFATAVADDAETSATLNDTADQLEAEAKAAGYPTDFLTPENPEDTPAVLRSEEYTKASEAMAARFSAECPVENPTPGAEDPAAVEPSTTVAP